MVSDFYVWELVFLRLGVRRSYVCGLRILTFGGSGFLRLGVRDSHSWGLWILTFGAMDSYV